MLVVGVDPGARHTGIVVVRDGRELYASTTVERGPEGALLDVEPRYLGDVVAAILAAVRRDWPITPDLIAVEGVTRPKQFLGGAHARGGRGGAAADPTAIIATATVLGAVLSRAFGVPIVVIPPGHNGSRPLETYPPELRPTRGKGAGTDRLRHERAAFDVALRGPAAHRVAVAVGSAYAP